MDEAAAATKLQALQRGRSTRKRVKTVRDHDSIDEHNIWCPESHVGKEALAAHTGAVRAVTFNDDDSLMATASAGSNEIL